MNNDRLNQFRQWLDLYDQQGIGANLRGARDLSGKNPFDVNGMKADWAMQMMGGSGDGNQESPNFFANEQQYQAPQYVQPQEVSRQMPQQRERPQRPDMRNFLAQVLQGNSGPRYAASQGGR